MIADLPDLSRLSLGQSHDDSKPTPISETLLDKLSRPSVRGGRVYNCSRNEHPPTTKKYDSSNCAYDGYFMVKTDLGYSKTVEEFDTSVLGEDREILDRFGKPCTMKALPRAPSSSEADIEQRTEDFDELNNQYLSNEGNFGRRCIQDKKLDIGLRYNDNLADLGKYTDFYYIDKRKKRWHKGDPVPNHELPQEGFSAADNELRAHTDRGFIFLSILESEDRKKELELPTEGVYKAPYLYVIIVCAAGWPGYGKVLMDLAERLAAEVGLDRIALSGLPNALGNYWGLGYRFYPWNYVTEYPVPKDYFTPQLKDGKETGKVFLDWEADDGLQTGLQQANAEGKEKAAAKRSRNEREDEQSTEADDAEHNKTQKKDDGDSPASLFNFFRWRFQWWHNR
tara:strand:- start:3709 stop:4896 length:1188 start_codon:yes stop_codon:yes gene_type:complete